MGSKVKMKDIKRNLDWLQKQIDLQMTSLPVTLLDSKDSTSSSVQMQKRKELEGALLPASKRLRRSSHSSPNPEPTAEDVMRPPRFDPGRSPCLNWIDVPSIASPTIGSLVYPASKPGHGDLMGLATGEDLSDLIIDPYMFLLCHHGNQHFDVANGDFQMLGSPKWHAWSTWFVGQAKATNKCGWPPAAYPGAKIGDVMHHMFPLHLDENHWVMAILSNTSGTHRLSLYSSLEGYQIKFKKQWSVIAAWLEAKASVDLSLSSLGYTVPLQPQQANAHDCGVFMCCELHWSMEGWPLQTILPANMKILRRRMVVELETWNVKLD